MAIGIIAELNPFHEGHKYLIDKAKKLTGQSEVVIVCSGSFVQRGEPSVYSSYIRANRACSQGADIVLELPPLYATSSAMEFARGAVSIFTKLSNIDYLCFGTECDNTSLLEKISKIILDEPSSYSTILKEELKKGQSYPKARATSVLECGHLSDSEINESKDILNKPNNILAIEYLNALRLFNSNIKPLPIKRIGMGYSDDVITKDTDSYISASAYRSALKNNPSLLYGNPDYDYYKDCSPVYMEDISDLMHYCLFERDDYSDILEIDKDLSNRILNYRDNYKDISSFIEALQSKNYTYSKISRALIHIFLGIKTDFSDNIISKGYTNFAKVIALKSGEILSKISSDKIKLLFGSDDDEIYSSEFAELLQLSNKAENLYKMIYKNKYHNLSNDEFPLKRF